MKMFYVRVGGKVAGPMTFAQLEHYASIGKVKPNYEVSEDQVTWVSAASIEGLSFDERGNSSSAGSPSTADRCPSCGSPVDHTYTTICVDCGFDRSSERSVVTIRPTTPNTSNSATNAQTRLLLSVGVVVLVGFGFLLLIFLSIQSFLPGSWDEDVRGFTNLLEKPERFYSAIERGKVQPGPVEWEVEFRGCNRVGRIEIAEIPRPSGKTPWSMFLLSSQEAIPQWQAIEPGTTVTLRAELKDAILYRIYGQPVGTRLPQRVVKGALTAERVKEAKKDGWMGLVIENARPVDPIPFAGQEAATQFAEYWNQDGFGVVIERDPQDRIVILAQSNRLPVVDTNAEPWVQVSSQLGDGAFALLSEIPHLRSVLIRSESMTNEALKTVQNFPSLTTLALYDTQIDDEGLVYLQSCDKLESLTLTGSKGITNAGLKHLASMKNLQQIDLSDTGVTRSGLAQLTSQLSKASVEAGPKNLTCEPASGADHLQIVTVFDEHQGPPEAVAFSPDGSLIASGGYLDKSVRVWNTESSIQRDALAGHSGRITSVAFNPLRKMLASGSDDHSGRIWDLNSGASLIEYRGHRQYPNVKLTSIEFSPDGRHVVSGSDDGTIQIWSVSSGESLAKLNPEDGTIHDVAYGSNGKWIVACGADKLQLWNVAAGSLVWERTDISASSIAIHPTNGTIACNSGREVRFFSTHSGEDKTSLPARASDGLSISHDGRWLATSDHGIEIWDIEKRARVASLAVPNNVRTRDVKFAPRSLRFAVPCDARNTIEIWEFSPPDEQKQDSFFGFGAPPGQ